MKVRLAQMNISSLAELEVTVYALWEELCTRELCIRLYQTMPVRLDAVIAAKGFRCKY